ncbi:14354_t:CDS:1, partial [Gigaspora rosea]
EDNEAEVFKEALEDRKLDWGPEQKRKWKTIWAGNSDEDRKKRRKLLMQGLVPVMKQEESSTEIKKKNENFEKMNDKFMEKIWKPRCEAVAKWEKKET